MIDDTHNSMALQAALDAGRAMANPIDGSDQDALVVVPQNYKVEPLDKHIAPYLPAPRRIQATVQLHTAPAFIAYVKKFKEERTVVFANLPVVDIGTMPVFTAIIDYHEQDKPSWCGHRAMFHCRPTQEWLRFIAGSKAHYTQAEFAAWLEQNQTLVVNPEGAALLELITNLEAHSNILCNQSMKLESGACKVLYSEDVSVRGGGTTVREGELDLPSMLQFAVAPFDGADPYRILARLKYRLSNRQLEFWFDPVALHLLLKDAADDVLELIKSELGIEPLIGQPQ